MSEPIPDQQFYDLATQVTDNAMFDNGAWMAPILNPGDDPRADHPIHYFAEDTRLSVCGNNFLPGSYVETVRDEDETRPDCTRCWQIIAAHQKKGRLDPRDKNKRWDDSLDIPPIILAEDSYPRPDFEHLLGVHQGSGRLQLNVTRMRIIDEDLFLMVDVGMTPTASLRRMFKRVNKPYDEVVIVGTDEYWDVVEDYVDNHRADKGAA